MHGANGVGELMCAEVLEDGSSEPNVSITGGAVVFLVNSAVRRTFNLTFIIKLHGELLYRLRDAYAITSALLELSDAYWGCWEAGS